MFATCCPSACAGSSIWRRFGSCSRSLISRNMFSSMDLTRQHDRRPVVAEREIGRRLPTATAATIAGRPVNCWMQRAARRPGLRGFWARTAMAPARHARRAARAAGRDSAQAARAGRRPAGSPASSGRTVLDLIGRHRPRNDVVVEEGRQPGADAALHPVADRSRCGSRAWRGRSPRRSRARAAPARRGRRSPAVSSCCSRSSATSSARWAEVSTATTTQTIATATITPIGTTTLRRVRSHRVGLRSSDIRGSANCHTGHPSGNILARRELSGE